MGLAISKCLAGQTDFNNNGVPDNKEIALIIEQFNDKIKVKKNKKILKKLLK
jgi:hypothetical protein|tara:strand:- start:2179 stop:2334 length:156 start_codon:yes stop_codon:yes gene_type:complete